MPFLDFFQLLFNVISYFTAAEVDLSTLPVSCRYRKHMEAHWENLMNTVEGIDLRVHTYCMPAYEGIRAENILNYDKKYISLFFSD